jgi:hypothetical protein
MNVVGILLFWSFLLPSFEVRDQSTDPVSSNWAVTWAVSPPARCRKPVDRRPHGALDQARLSPVVWDEEEDSDGDFVDEIGVSLTSSRVVDCSAWMTFAFSQSKSVWASHHRIPLRC